MDLDKIFEEISLKIDMMTDEEVMNINEKLKIANSMPFIFDEIVSNSESVYETIPKVIDYSEDNSVNELGIHIKNNSVSTSTKIAIAA
ncbi:hypothetical protein EVU91_08040 [Macrococcoides bohemicum]|uniref:hypothetical protein n=1 Tax=Macrococcoides bohemicum TaxID=1903056 RepID=UPI00105A4FF4|nr:hypothetical protein [Macrococcus bohemicus]TDL37037.1 hypothetical protein EVU91_08040 [Macrococcus bohemicus]